MSGRYDDIIHLPHHVSATRKRMPLADRAAQFSPFAALTGHDAAIRETARLTDTFIELDVDGKALLNEKLQLLARVQHKQPLVTVTYFVPDGRKNGGAYVVAAEVLKKLDVHGQAMILMDGTVIGFDRIYDIGIAEESK